MKTLLYDNPHLLALTIILLLVAGISSLATLPRMEDPRIVNRFAIVVTQFPGASPERVESLVTEKIENALEEISEIQDVESSSRAGVSVVSIELGERVTDAEPVWSEIRAKLDDAERGFPAGALKPVFDDQRTAAAYSIIVGLTPRPETQTGLPLLARLSEELAARLRNAPGTELVRVYGGPEEEITATVDGRELAALGMDAAAVSRLTALSDPKVPAGAMRGDSRDLLFEVAGELDTLRRVAEIPIAAGADQQVLRLGDIATIEKGVRTPPREMAMVAGERGVLVAGRMREGYQSGTWADNAVDIVEAFKREYGAAADITVLFKQDDYTGARINELGLNLVYGALAVFAIVWGVMGFRAAVLVGSALPLCASAVLFGLNVFGVPLHQISIFGMILALGLLIDNAIVVTDETGTNLSKGMGAREAVARTADHLFVPLLGSTLTTVIAFMPILLIAGNVGEFIGSIAVSVILALASSFLVSITVIAALAGYFGGAGTGGQRLGAGSGPFRPAAWFRRALEACMRRPALAIAVSLILPAAGFMRIPDLGNQFFPPADRDHFHVQMWLSPEASIAQTFETAKRVDDRIRGFEDVEYTFWLAGGSVPKVYYNMLMNEDDTPHYAQAVVQANSFQAVKRMAPALQEALDRGFPGARIVVRRLGQGPPVDAPVEIRLLGPGVDTLRELGREVRARLHEMPEVPHTRAQLEAAGLRFKLNADEEEVRMAGLTLTGIALQMQSNLEGQTGGSMLEGTEDIPVRVRFGDDTRGDLGAIRSMELIPETGGGWMPLTAAGEVRLEPDESAIWRRNGVRCNTVKAYPKSGALPPEVTTKFMAKPGATPRPSKRASRPCCGTPPCWA